MTLCHSYQIFTWVARSLASRDSCQDPHDCYSDFSSSQPRVVGVELCHLSHLVVCMSSRLKKRANLNHIQWPPLLFPCAWGLILNQCTGARAWPTCGRKHRRTSRSRSRWVKVRSLWRSERDWARLSYAVASFCHPQHRHTVTRGRSGRWAFGKQRWRLTVRSASEGQSWTMLRRRCWRALL